MPRRSMRITLALLMGVAGFVLLIVCGNISGLLIARGASREKEFAIRRALGAGSWRLVRQLMVENLLLSLIGGGFGLLVAFAGIRLLRARLDFNSYGAFIGDKITMNGDVLVFTLAVSIFTALLFGLLPAFDTSHMFTQVHRCRKLTVRIVRKEDRPAAQRSRGRANFACADTAYLLRGGDQGLVRSGSVERWV